MRCTPIALVLGLGFERDRAVGVLEYFEAERFWAFRAEGFQSSFDKAVRATNLTLFEELGDKDCFSYPLKSPFSAFELLENLVNGAKRDARVVIVPLGPKIFTLLAVLVATLHEPEVAVWRVSAAGNEPAIDLKAEGHIVGIRVVWPVPASDPQG